MREGEAVANLVLCSPPPSHVRKAGRSSYVPRDVLRNVPDPGAMAVAAWLKGAAEALRKRQPSAQTHGMGGAP